MTLTRTSLSNLNSVNESTPQSNKFVKLMSNFARKRIRGCDRREAEKSATLCGCVAFRQRNHFAKLSVYFFHYVGLFFKRWQTPQRYISAAKITCTSMFSLIRRRVYDEISSVVFAKGAKGGN